jgi:hypothetical protein
VRETYIEQRDRASLLCDFCCRTRPALRVWALGGPRVFDTPTVTTKDQDGLWAACDECHPKVEAAQAEVRAGAPGLAFDVLVKHAARHAVLPAGFSRAMVRLSLATFYFDLLPQFVGHSDPAVIPAPRGPFMAEGSPEMIARVREERARLK